MILKQFAVPEALDGAKLSVVVRRMLPLVADGCIREAFVRRDVKADGTRTPPDALMHTGAQIAVYLSEGCETAAPEILYEDEWLLVVNKPAGISCEADEKGGLTIGELLQSAYPERFTVPPMPCHRLDNPTDGLLLLAKDEPTLQLMEQAFRERRVHKRYQCLVKGTPVPAHAVLDAYLRKDAAHATVTVIDRPERGALSIRTEYKVLAAGEVSRLSVMLHTGRTHQIRAHLASVGHPLLGDDKYGDRAFNRLHKAKRLMLTATELSFTLEGRLAYLNAKRFALEPMF